jgi:prophage DNA circulation protein
MVSYVALNYSARAAVPDVLMMRSRRFSKTNTIKRKAFKPALVILYVILYLLYVSF